MGKEGNFLPSQKEMFSQAETEIKVTTAANSELGFASAAVLTTVGAAQPLSGVVSADTESTGTSANSSYNYGEALQKSMFFYQVQQSGVLPDWNEVS